MAEFAYDINGGTPVIKKLQVSAAIARGTMAEAAANSEAGLAIGTVAATANAVGLALDAAAAPDGSHATNPGTDPAKYISVVVNPYAITRWRLSGGAGDGVTLTTANLLTVVTPDTLGDDILAGTTYDTAAVWGYTGANAGQVRRTQDATGNVDVAFRYDIAVGDTFLQVGLWPYSEQNFPELNTSLTEVDASNAVDSDNDNYRTVDLDLRDAADNGATNSYAFMMPVSHFLAGSTTIA